MIGLSKIKDRPHLIKVLKNGGWLIFDAVLRGVSALVVGTWIARYLGPEQFGKLTYVLAYLMFFQVIANLGMDGIVIRDIVNLTPTKNQNKDESCQKDKEVIKKQELRNSRNKIEIGRILGSAFILRLIVGLLCWVIAVGGMSMLYGWNSENVLLTALAGGCLIFQAANTIDLWFQSQTQSRRTVLVKLFAFIVTNGLRVAFIVGELPLLSFAIAMLLEFLITAIALIYAYRRMPCGSSWTLDIKNVGLNLVRESWPYIISGISVAMYMRIDQVMVRSIMGEKELGIYSAAIILSSMWYVLPSIACTSLMPTLTLSKSINHDLYLERLTKLFRLLLISSIFISIIVAWQSNILVEFFYGDKFSDSSKVLKLLIFTTIPVFLGVGQGAWLINEKKSNLFLIQTLSGGAVCIALNMILIPIFGLMGAATSLLIAQFISTLAINAFLEKKLFTMQIGVYKKIK
ncbi:flippase [Polynucleobacter sp. Tro8-14-1]|uniref:flippase n=1 Tax=Polynucleobacter sp. Tro8-14-1 TaxID=1758383 RepID=UPI001C0DDD85|nr:flippase [Polynucleobacter sp. Tro8-14-1]MBU3563622.1 flippase [Polynucleobacter sp. Tro8-14-1]